MKNKKKRIQQRIACTLCISMLLGLISLPGTSTVHAQESAGRGAALLEEMCEQEQAENTIDEETLETQDELNETYAEIEDNMILSETKDPDGIETVYEDEYAGSYIDDDKLVVCMTEKQDADKDICENAENVEYRVVEYSYNELSALQDELSETYSDLYDRYPAGSEEKDLLSSISGFGVDEELNALVVEIVNLTKDKKAVFENLFGAHNEIVLRRTESIPENCSTYCPGKGIYVITKRKKTYVEYNTLSIGYRAYRKTKNGKQYGFVTAAHGCQGSIDKNIYVSDKFNNVIGKIIKQQNSGSVDACFVEIDKNHLVGTTTQYSNVLGETKNGDKIAKDCYMKSVSKGSRVYKVGVTTYRTAATIKNTKWNDTIEGIRYKNLTLTSGFCDKGDSGGLVYTQYKGEYVPAGIIKGHDKKEKTSFYIKATEIISALNVYPY